jgi:glycine betaine/proline transport system substrate-binding protein
MQMGRRSRRFVFALALAAAAAGCGDDDGNPNAAVIELAVNPWTGSAIDAAVAKILLQEELGLRVNLTDVDEFEQWPRIARGELHACLEVWPSGHADDIRTYITERGEVQDAGLLGVMGKIGWYLPTYLLAEHPELATWEGFKDPDNVALFQTAATAPRGRFLAGDPTWVQYDQQIIDNLGLDLRVVFAGSEAALLAEVDAALSARQPILFYFFVPHSAHRRYDLTEVTLPPYSATCYERAAAEGIDCDYPVDHLFKIVWPGLQTYAPDAYEFLHRFQYGTEDQTELLALVNDEGYSVEDAARLWIAENESTWQAWLEN